MLKKIENGICIVELNGKIDSYNSADFEVLLNSAIEDNSNKIIIDCKELTYISSSGLRIMLQGLKKLTSINGKFAISGLNENITEVFKIAGFANIFKIYDNLNSAIESM